MKTKRILSLLLMAVMLMSLFVTAYAEETATVTVTQNGTSIDGLTGLPLSFSPRVDFPTAVADGTDLSVITLTAAGSETPETITITQGTATDGYFTAARIKFPVLSAGTEYTLTIPAIGENAAKTVTFTTVGGPYIIKEDFNGSFFGDWYNKNSSGSRRSLTMLQDTDGDGVKDAYKESSGTHGTLLFPTSIPLKNIYTQLTLETRVKFTPNSANCTLDDGAIWSGNLNNGFLMRVQGVHANRSMDIRTETFGDTNADSTGVLTYGGAKDKYYAVNKSDYKIYGDRWYTIRVTMNSSGSKFNVFITDDNGNSYQGSSVITRYGSSSNWRIETLDLISFTYGTYVKSTIDYLYVWDNADLGEVTSTLNGVTDVAKNGAEEILTFTNDITEADVAKIKVSDALSSTASETVTATATLVDSKTVKLEISNLAYATAYNINVPQLGSNKAKVFTFTTEPAPVEVKYDGVALEGKTDAPLTFTATADLLVPVAAGTDVSGITINGGATVTPTLSADGASVSLAISGLEAARTNYTLTIPALGSNAAAEVTFGTSMEQYLYRKEFDGFDTGIVYSSFKPTVEDGVATMTPAYANSYFYIDLSDNPIDLTGGGNYIFETRVKYDRYEETDDGNDNTPLNSGQDNRYLVGFIDTNPAQRAVAIRAKSGKLALGGLSDPTVTTDVDMVENKWYIIRIEKFANKNSYYTTVIDDATGTVLYEGAAGSKGYDMEKITRIDFPYRAALGATVDYIRIWDEPLVNTYGDVVFDKTTLTEGEITASSTYNCEAAKPVMLMIAFYNANGEVTRIVSTKATTTVGEGSIETKATPATGEVKARAFLWEDLTSLIPYAAHAEL